MDDKHLRQDVLDELENEPSVDATHIGVAAENGVVALTGHVSSYAEKVEVWHAVRRVKGVRAIADEVEVRYPGEKKTADDEIARRAIKILEWYAIVPDNPVQVTVEHGLVTLSGEVGWQYQKKAAEDAVRKLSGITAVTNAIVIVPKIEPGNIQKKVEDVLRRRAQFEAEGIRIKVGEGNTVSLEGVVDSWEEREAVESAAWSVAGVRSVDNRLTIVH